jgi:tripartite-type tricarboxylate transporter receptor subunit TctC
MHGDVDKERSAFLASHIEDILTDEEFIQKAEEMNRPISYLSAAEQNELVQSIFSDLSDDRKAEIKQVLTEKYVR